MQFKIGPRELPPSGPCLIVLEAGMNHNGDMGLAREMIAAAAQVGADAIKLQSFQTHRLVLPDDASWDFRKSVELTPDQHQELKAECDACGIIFISTPCDEEGVDLLANLNAPAMKIGSFDLTHHPLLAHAAGKGIPLILSTGVATLAEIEEAVRVIRENGDPALALLHCVSRYPAPEDGINLRAIETLREVFNCAVGYSDHTEGIGAAAASVALGAAIIEKHYTLDKKLPGPDQAMSADPGEITQLVRAVREAEKALGSPRIEPAPEEIELGRLARRSLHTIAPIQAGQSFTEENIDVLRPPGGLEPRHKSTVLQRKAAEDIAAYTPITWQHLSP
jgi:N,N'-diacetyllegionaminate synthase